MRIANYFYPVLGLLTILRYSIQGLGFSNLSMFSGVMEMIARCGVSLWLVPALGFLGVCFGDPIAWIAADLFLVPAYLYVYRRLKVRTGV
jgi:Na+-driven multidrug efflux pump